MPKVMNPYQDCNILALNLMEARHFKTNPYKKAETVLILFGIIAFSVLITSQLIGDISFFADCRNIANGDVCRITMH